MQRHKMHAVFAFRMLRDVLTYYNVIYTCCYRTDFQFVWYSLAADTWTAVH